MTKTDTLLQVLREWGEISAQRSMIDFLRFIRGVGLSMPQVSVLMQIYHHGSCGISDVSQHTGTTSAASSQMVERLVHLGFVHRVEDAADRRNKQLNLTESGHSLVAQGIEARRKWLETLVTHIPPDQQDAMAISLANLVDVARQWEGSQTGLGDS